VSPQHREEVINDSVLEDDLETRPTEAAIDNAAAALREVEVGSVQTEGSAQPIATPRSQDLDQMSIDDLRKLAAKLDIPDRGQIVEKDKLMAEIRLRMG
jgi:hypothetical protein